MPSLQNTVLTDRQTTPVAHTFKPRSNKNEVATYASAGPSGSPVEDKLFTISHPRRNGDRVKITMKLAVPTVVSETINGVTRLQLERVDYIDVSFNFHRMTTEAQRNNLMGMLRSATDIACVTVNDTVVKGDAIW